MLFLLTFIIVGLLLSLVTGLFSQSWTVKDKYGDFIPSNLAYTKLALVILGAIIAGFVNPISVERIDVGNVGLKVNNTGDERGVSKTTYVTGWVFYNSWLSRIKEFPTTQQHIDYEETSIITKGGFQAVIKPSFNWSVNPANAADMYQSLRKDVDEIQNTWLKNAIIGAVNDVANLYTVDSIFNHRAEFENDIVKEANKRVSKWFNVSQLRTNIVPPKEITEAINLKTKAVQEAQAALQQKIVAEANAQTQIAKARGDSAQAVIKASGEAEAVLKVQRVLSPVYVEYIKWSNASNNVPRVPSTVIGGGTSTLLNLK